MARNAEKSQSMLNKFILQKSGQLQQERRPYLSTLVDNVQECEKWRKHIIHDIVNKISEIQNTNINESDALQMNEYINKLLREKVHWERRIKQLGGTDYTAMKQNLFDVNNVICIDNYYYFGAAKQHPYVQKLIKRKQEQIKSHYTYSQLQHMVQGTIYYDNNNSADKELLDIEREAEQQLKHDMGYIENDSDAHMSNNDHTNAQQQMTPEQIEQMLVQQRKAELLAKYG